MDLGHHERDYLAQGALASFPIRVGALAGIDRERRTVYVAPSLGEDGALVTSARSFGLYTLVIAIGTRPTILARPGVAKHALRLDTSSRPDASPPRWSMPASAPSAVRAAAARAAPGRHHRRWCDGGRAGRRAAQEHAQAWSPTARQHPARPRHPPALIEAARASAVLPERIRPRRAIS